LSVSCGAVFCGGSFTMRKLFAVVISGLAMASGQPVFSQGLDGDTSATIVTELPAEMTGPLSEVSAAANEAQNEAVALRLMRIEQLIRAQQNLNRGSDLSADLAPRLDRIEARLNGIAAEPSPLAGVSAVASEGAAPMDDQASADLRVRLTALEDSVRRIEGQTDEILRLVQRLEEANQRAAADMEFRFQALEARAHQQQNATSDEPLVIGRIAAPEPVMGDGEVMPTEGPLVGEQADLIPEATVNEPLADPDKLYDRGLASLRAGKYAAARKDFLDLLKDYPKHKRAGNAQYWLGESYYVERDFKQAAQAFLNGYTTYSTSDKAPDSLLKLAMSLSALEQKTAACDAFADLLVKFPNASSAVRQRASNEQKRAGCKTN
jgi:tol-pal system protein YbgF